MTGTGTCDRRLHVFNEIVDADLRHSFGQYMAT
jgi:hypothetical protein